MGDSSHGIYGVGREISVRFPASIGLFLASVLTLP